MWPVSQVAQFINAHKDSPAQFKVNNQPFVSTFEGTNFVSQWSQVEQSTGPLFLVPSWTSMGPGAFQSNLGLVDGTCKQLPNIYIYETVSPQTSKLTQENSSPMGCVATQPQPCPQDHRV